MNNFGYFEIAKWCQGHRSDNQEFEITGVSTDTRTIKPGELFIPLTGENFDGHKFINSALEKGAVSFLTENDVSDDLKNVPRIRVDNTQKAYQRIARHYLKRFNIPVVAITGSNGKTTTKDIIAHLLKQKFKVLASEKNFNNEVGVPKTVMQLDSSHEVLIVELAMRGRGQIRELAEIVEPDAAVITNIGESHFELLGSYQAIAEAKCEILDFLNPNGYAVLNADDRWFGMCAEKSPARIVKFGIRRPADVRLLKSVSLGLDGYELHVSMDNEVQKFGMPLLGRHNIYNVLCAIALVKCFNLDVDEIARGLATLIPSDKRMEVWKSAGGWVVLNDTYNASPASTTKALEILESLETKGRKIAALADMLELGDIAVDSHREVGSVAAGKGLDLLFTFGGLGDEIAAGAMNAGMDTANIFHFEDKKELVRKISEAVRPGDFILVKGSRRMKMEEVSQALMDLKQE